MLQIAIILEALESARDWYIPMPVHCRVIDARTALNLSLTSGDSAITLSDGTTDIGVITITQSSSAAGDEDVIAFDSTSEGKVALGPGTALKVSCDATPGQGRATITVLLDDFHGA